MSVVSGQPDGGIPDTSPRPLRKAVLDNENDQDDEDASWDHHVSGDELAIYSPSCARLTSGIGSITQPSSSASSAPLYLTLRTLLI